MDFITYLCILTLFFELVEACARTNTAQTRIWDKRGSFEATDDDDVQDDGNDERHQIWLNSKCGKTLVQPNLSKARHIRAVLRLPRKSPSKIPSRIVGGSYAQPYSWPWQIVLCEMIENECSFFCGGSVIGTRWVLTAAHCVTDFDTGKKRDANLFRVKTGVYLAQYKKHKEPHETLHNVVSINVHYKYNNVFITDDIAILEVYPEIKFSKHVQPVCLPRFDEEHIKDQEIGWVTGWGTTKENGQVSNKLKQADVPFMGWGKCNLEQYVEPNQICAGEAGEDACQGDSGGPLVKKNPHDRWFQYGVVSNGIGCARPGLPGIYTRVSSYCSYIESTTKHQVICRNPNSFKN